MPVTSYTIFISLALLLLACKPEQKPVTNQNQDLEKNEQKIKSQFMEANKQLMQKENDEMWDPLESTCRHASLSIL